MKARETISPIDHIDSVHNMASPQRSAMINFASFGPNESTLKANYRKEAVLISKGDNQF